MVPMSDDIPFKPRNIWKARLSMDKESIVKDYTDNPLVARLFGRFCLNREERALRRLDGVEGVPRLLGRPTPYRLAMTRVPGTPLARIAKGELAEPFLARLKSLFEEMHGRGVAHGDAHFRNILVHDGRPYLVDFSTAYIKPEGRPYSRRLFSWFRLLDLERIYKVERHFFGRGEAPRMFLLYRIIKRKRKR